MGNLFLHGRTQKEYTSDAFAKLTVNCPVGVTVRADSVDTPAIIDIASTNGVAVFNKLVEGEWDVTFVGVEHTPVRRIKIDSLDNEITLRYFEAFIEVVYPVGSTCTCTNGTTVLTASNTTGNYTFIVPNTGIWTITSSNGEVSDSKNVNISATEQTVNIELSYLKLPVLDTSYPEDITVIPGNDAVFNVVFVEDGYPRNYTYKWYIDNILVNETTTPTYTYDTSECDATYTVRCDVVNDAGEVSTRFATMTAIAYKLPVLNTSYPANATIAVGESVELNVVIDKAGYPDSYTYQWYNNGVVITDATSSSYTYAGMKVGIIDTLYCIVSNAAGSVRSVSATVTTDREYLFVNGEFTSGSYASHTNEPTNSYVSVENGYITIVADGSYNTTGMWLDPQIDLTDKSTLVFRSVGMVHSVNDPNYNDCGTWYFGVDDNIFAVTAPSLIDTGYVKYTTALGTNHSGYQLFIVDVSGLSGKYYVKMHCSRLGIYYQDRIYVDAIYFQ